MTGPVARSARQSTHSKGQRIARLAKLALEADGYQVQLCPNQVVWVPDKKRPPKIVRGRPMYPRQPVSVQSDFFGLWDGIVVGNMHRFFVQVTVWDGVANRRAKIQAAKWNGQFDDRILAYMEGRNRHFRVLRWPEFQWTGESLMVPKEKADKEADGAEWLRGG